MASGFRYVRKRAGVKALLSLPGVQKDLLERAQRVAAVAEPAFQGQDADIRVVASVQVGKVRAHASVAAIGLQALTIEQDHRILGGAINAARG